MYFPVDFPHEVIAYTCMYLVDFPQHKHTHTQQEISTNSRQLTVGPRDR